MVPSLETSREPSGNARASPRSALALLQERIWIKQASKWGRLDKSFKWGSDLEQFRKMNARVVSWYGSKNQGLNASMSKILVYVMYEKCSHCHLKAIKQEIMLISSCGFPYPRDSLSLFSRQLASFEPAQGVLKGFWGQKPCETREHQRKALENHREKTRNLRKTFRKSLKIDKTIGYSPKQGCCYRFWGTILKKQIWGWESSESSFLLHSISGNTVIGVALPGPAIRNAGPFKARCQEPSKGFPSEKSSRILRATTRKHVFSLKKKKHCFSHIPFSQKSHKTQLTKPPKTNNKP